MVEEDKHKAPVPVTGKGAGIQPGTGTPVVPGMLRTGPFGWVIDISHRKLSDLQSLVQGGLKIGRGTQQD